MAIMTREIRKNMTERKVAVSFLSNGVIKSLLVVGEIHIRKTVSGRKTTANLPQVVKTSSRRKNRIAEIKKTDKDTAQIVKGISRK